jgi:threonine dehydrogenase-like Zn-dependent dehydrogenase
MARAIGADVVLDPRQVDVVRQIESDTGKRGVDLAVDCAAKDDTIGEAIRVVRSAGRVVITGIPAENTTPIDLHELRRKEAVLFNVRRSNHETHTAVEMLRARPDLFGPIVTHTISVDNIQLAFEMLEHKQDGAAKIVLNF